MSCLENQELCITEGTDDSIVINNYSDENNTIPLDITGYTFQFTAKKDIDDPDAKAVLTKDITSHTDPTQGVTTISFSRSDTIKKNGVYVFDIRRKDTSNNTVVIIKGNFTIEQAITDR